MSITANVEVRCPCGAALSALVVHSLNAGRHPQLRELVLARRLHVFSCATCFRPLTLVKDLLYFDLERRQLIGVFPEEDRCRERASAERVMALYDRLRLGGAGPVEALADELLVRLCFGYEELREKLVADEAGLSDLALEALKCDVLAMRPDLLVSGVRTLRLDSVGADGRLRFLPEWEDGSLFEGPALWMDRAHHDAVLARTTAGILASRPGLTSGPHVSLLRLIPWVPMT